MVIQAKCIQRFRDEHNKIYGYRLQDINGQIQDVTPENLKEAIRTNQIHVVNLTLTSDNRLVDTTEKQLQTKILGKAPVIQNDDKYSDVAKALVLLDKELLDMGDSYKELVEDRAYAAGLIKSFSNTENLDGMLYNAYIELLNRKPSEVDTIISMWYIHNSYEIFEINIKHENVSKITQSNIYKALCTVYKHIKEQKFTKGAIKPLGEFLSKIKTTGIASINIGYNVGNCYYKYLDSKLFGTITNSVFTVGHVITASDISEHKEYKGYSYILHKDINRCGSPDVAIAAMFKNTADGNVQIDIKLARQGYLSESQHCVGLVGYIKNFCSITVNSDEPVEECAKKLANIFNKLAPKLYDIADDNQSLYFMKKYGAPLEQIGNVISSHTDKELLDLAISRWTTIRGDKTPAKLDKAYSNGKDILRVLYSNNISENGANYKLFVEYDNKSFSLSVVNGNNTSDVIIKETAEMTGPIKDNSAVISEVLTKAIITANVRHI